MFSAELSTFKSKSNSNILDTVALLLLTDPIIISSFLKLPWISNIFKVWDSLFQPFLATKPEIVDDGTIIFSFSKNDTFSKVGVNPAKSLTFITLPKLFSDWYVPPLVLNPAIEYLISSPPLAVLIPTPTSGSIVKYW